MAIPDYQAFMLPLLIAISDGNDYEIRRVTQELADEFNLAPAEREQLLPSGQQTIVANRVAWAKTYLKKAGLLENPTRGEIRITPEGLKALARNLRQLTDTSFSNIQRSGRSSKKTTRIQILSESRRRRNPTTKQKPLKRQSTTRISICAMHWPTSCSIAPKRTRPSSSKSWLCDC